MDFWYFKKLIANSGCPIDYPNKKKKTIIKPKASRNLTYNLFNLSENLQFTQILFDKSYEYKLLFQIRDDLPI